MEIILTYYLLLCLIFEHQSYSSIAVKMQFLKLFYYLTFLFLCVHYLLYKLKHMFVSQ